MQRLKTRNDILIGATFGFCILVNILIWVNHVHQVKSDKQATINFATQRNANLVVALEQYAIRTLKHADAALRLLQMEYGRDSSRIDINYLLYNHAVNKDFFKGVAIINEKGKLEKVDLNIHSDTLSFADRDYFIFHSKSRSDELFISKPVISKTIGKAVVVVSRRLNKADGSFGGVVALQIEPSTFTAFYAQANLRQRDIISLISPDGITYARRTGKVESYGEDISKSPLFIHLKQKPVDNYFANDAIRGIPTFFSYRKMKEYPIISTVGTAEADVLANYYDRVDRDRISAIIISVLMVLFSLMVVLILLHRRRTAEKFVEEEQRYQRKLTEQMILTQEREREVIGHELHDNVNQVLTTVKLYLELAQNHKEARDEMIPKSIDLVMTSINEIRNLSRDLSAPTLGTKSLVDSVTALVEMVSSSSGLSISFDHTSYKRTVSMNQTLALYRILQEQLNNIIKHARAKNVWILLVQKEDKTILHVKDDGIGFDPNAKRAGIGLNNINSRVNLFYGQLAIDSSPGKGCRMAIVMPSEYEEGDAKA